MEEYYRILLHQYIRSIKEESTTFEDIKATTVYRIERIHYTKSAELIFTSIKDNKKAVCLKQYKDIEDKLYKYKGREIRNKNMFEGYRFNKRFSPGVYLGIAKIVSKDPYFITLSDIKEMIEEKDMDYTAEYVFIMKALPQLTRSDFWFNDWGLDSIEGVEFIARALGKFQSGYEQVHEKSYGSSAQLEKKLNANIEVFFDALNKLPEISSISGEEYRIIPDIIYEYFLKHKKIFDKRWKAGKIKRCHGDIKRKNIYITPANTLAYGGVNIPGDLRIIDCVDFRQDYYCIDPVSDAAMLAMDIGVHFAESYEQEGDQRIRFNPGIGYTRKFIKEYLFATGEESAEAGAAMVFYLLEKTMIISYLNILYDYNKMNTTRYLDSALYFSLHIKNITNAIWD